MKNPRYVVEASTTQKGRYVLRDNKAFKREFKYKALLHLGKRLHRSGARYAGIFGTEAECEKEMMLRIAEEVDDENFG